MGKQDEVRSAVIFGGAGFIGANLARHLLLEGDAQVHIFDNLSRKGVQHNLKQLKRLPETAKRLRVTIGDIRDAAAVERAVTGANEIYQFAAQVAVTTSVNDPRADFETNVVGTFNVLEAARKSGKHPFLLFTSTNKVYGEMVGEPLTACVTRYSYAQRQGVSEEQPLDFHSPYGCSKGAADQYVRDYSRMYGVKSVVFRMSCIAGEMQYGNEDQGWVAHFLYHALRRLPITIWGDGRQVRDILYVGDLVQAIDQARQSIEITNGQTYNIGGGAKNAISLIELIEEIELLTGEKLEFAKLQRRPADQHIYVTDYSKFMRHTGWMPRSSVREILGAIHDFYKAHCDIFGETPAPVPLQMPAARRPAFMERTA